jgi:Spy/CpxP family protein refolding chaperone
VIKNCKLARSLLFAVMAFAANSTFAQQPGLPSPEGLKVPSSPSVPQRNVESELSTMTTRDGLSNDQAEKIRAILKDEEQKADVLLKDRSVPPPAIFSKLKALREDETTRVSAVLTPEQRTKYQSDLAQMGPPQSQSPAGFPPPPPGPQ